MNQPDQTDRNTIPSPPNAAEGPYQDQFEDEINLVDLVYPLFKHIKFLILFCLIVTFVVGIATLRQPKTYEATATILPEVSQSAGVGTELKAAFLEQFGVSGLGGDSTTSSDMFEAILNSRELAKGVLKRSRYADIMGIPDAAKATNSLTETIKVKKSRDDPTISVSFQGTDPIMIADLVNTYLRELDEYNRTYTVTSARRLRQYIETRLVAAQEELDQAQQGLRDFQEKHRAVSISEQAEATLKVLSDMEVQRVALEVEIAAKEKFFKGPHIEIEQLKARMEALQKNIDRLTYSREKSVQIEGDKGRVEFYIPLTKIPALSFDESGLLLKAKAKTGVVTMLTTQLEQARLDETKDMPTVNVLDWARPPELPVKPKLKLNVILGFVVSLFLGVFIIFFWEFINRLDQDPETAPKWLEIKKGLKKPFSIFSRRKKR